MASLTSFLFARFHHLQNQNLSIPNSIENSNTCNITMIAAEALCAVFNNDFVMYYLYALANTRCTN